MASTTRWLTPRSKRPADYPEELPFLPHRRCLLSRSGPGETQLFSVVWPAVIWPADLSRQPLERRTYPTSPEEILLYRVARSSPLPQEVAVSFRLIREMSGTAGWIDPKYHTPWFEVTEVQLWKGPRLRLVSATSAGVTLQEGHPEREAVGV